MKTVIFKKNRYSSAIINKRFNRCSVSEWKNLTLLRTVGLKLTTKIHKTDVASRIYSNIDRESHTSSMYEEKLKKKKTKKIINVFCVLTKHRSNVRKIRTRDETTRANDETR